MDNKKVVLLIEDERPLAEAIKLKLAKNDFDAVIVRTADQGLNFLEDLKQIDVIWLDHYLLGTKTGLDFVVAVKQHKAWKKIPIFVVSNTASSKNVHSYISLGISRYYVKADYRLDQIIDDIKNLLAQGKEK